MRRDERGQTTLLIIGFAIVAIMMVAVVVDASAAYLRRTGLDSLADAAALSAADGVQGRQVYEGGLGKRAEIDPVVARRYVAQYLRDTGAAVDTPASRTTSTPPPTASWCTSRRRSTCRSHRPDGTAGRRSRAPRRRSWWSATRARYCDAQW